MIKTFAATVACLLPLAGAASAATVSFTGVAGPDVASLSGSTGIAGIGYSVTPVATGLENDVAFISQTVDGLGVNGFTPGSPIPDFEPGVIDGSIFSAEGILVTFDSAVNLDSFTLGSFSTADLDDYTLVINGVEIGSSLTAGINDVNATNVTSFLVVADGDTLSDLIGPQGLFGNDEFTLASFTVSAVPLPAGGALLLAGLGGLAAMRRSRRKA